MNDNNINLNFSKIEVFAAGGNCFGSQEQVFPKNICNAINLKTLVLSGINSGESCRDNIWSNTPFKHIFTGFLIKRTSSTNDKNKKNDNDNDNDYTESIGLLQSTNTIPSCIFQLKQIETIFAGGNFVL